jgi:hypothetical protein
VVSVTSLWPYSRFSRPENDGTRYGLFPEEAFGVTGVEFSLFSYCCSFVCSVIGKKEEVVLYM